MDYSKTIRIPGSVGGSLSWDYSAYSEKLFSKMSHVARMSPYGRPQGRATGGNGPPNRRGNGERLTSNTDMPACVYRGIIRAGSSESEELGKG